MTVMIAIVVDDGWVKFQLHADFKMESMPCAPTPLLHRRLAGINMVYKGLGVVIVHCHAGSPSYDEAERRPWQNGTHNSAKHC